MIKSIEFHHLGLAVKHPKKALNVLSALGYKINEPIFDPLQKVNVQMCKSSKMPDIELVYANKNTKSPIDNILKENTELAYHYCYSTNNINKSINEFKKNDINPLCISKPKNAILFNNNKVGFYYIFGYGIIELLEIQIK